MSEPDNKPLQVDETEQRLYAEFYECVRERAVAEDKISKPRKSMLHADCVILHEEADAIRDRCDQIRVKIRDYKRAKGGNGKSARNLNLTTTPSPMTCSTCTTLSMYLESFILRQSQFSAAHLRAVQAGDLATARRIDGLLSEASKGVRLFTDKLRDHEAAHREYKSNSAGA